MKKYGQLSSKDIEKEKAVQTGLKIVPFSDNCLKGASYDISPTIIAMSTKVGMLETVYCDKSDPDKYYIYVKAKDTVLAISKEYIVLPSYMAGYVVSRVSKVSEGFRHVSTSIDPNWNGALLIGLSNPTNKSIKVFVGGNDNREKNDSLATITLHYLNTSCEENNIEYRGMRLDLLNKIRYSDYSRKGIRNWFYKVFYIRRKKYTDFFFRYCDRKT
ncbi:MAG: hypothetical protein IJ167_10705, partial [Lachnospiraceae bacterium]|nr:hypothetical protein [Lachnospiraceae bacterium]